LTEKDIPALDVRFVDGLDEEASPLGAKGLGELTAVSVAPAIANAVYQATGMRVRDLPITMENRCKRWQRHQPRVWMPRSSSRARAPWATAQSR
jgi:CO/xanthine dehydrogenase Mo-binding subunit